MKRIFVAVNLPKEIKESLEKAKEPFEEGAVRWVKKENLHITLLFLGDIKEEGVDDIYKKLKDLLKQEKSFFLETKKIEYDNIYNPRLIWVVLKENKGLEQIARSLGNVKFKPHITLARIKAWAFKAIEVEERPVIEKAINLSFSIDSIEIMESILKKTGPEYKVLKSIKL